MTVLELIRAHPKLGWVAAAVAYADALYCTHQGHDDWWYPLIWCVVILLHLPRRSD